MKPESLYTQEVSAPSDPSPCRTTQILKVFLAVGATVTGSAFFTLSSNLETLFAVAASAGTGLIGTMASIECGKRALRIRPKSWRTTIECGLLVAGAVAMLSYNLRRYHPDWLQQFVPAFVTPAGPP